MPQEDRPAPLSERLITTVGLVIAVLTGIAGGQFADVTTQSVLFAISSLGWVTATAVLAARLARDHQTLGAAAFLILTVAEPLLWVSGRPDSADYVTGFMGGAMFYIPGMLLLAAAPTYPRAVRAFAALATIVWAVGAAMFLTGVGYTAADPMGQAGYTLLSAAFLGVAYIEWRGRAPAARVA